MSQALTKSHMNQAKTSHYNVDGNGRDSYIFKTNGGFFPDRKTNGVEGLGTFVTVKQRPQDSLASIHSKPVIYNNNGSGRDTYISSNSGGLRTIH